MTDCLPQGIWDDPTKEEQEAYCEFLEAWNLSDEEYEQYYREWLSTQEIVAAFAYGYDTFSCGTCDHPGSGNQEGNLLVLPTANPYLINSSVVGTEADLYDIDGSAGQCDWMAFVASCYHVLDKVSPMSFWGHPVPGSSMCYAQWGYARFDVAELPDDAIINYAMLRMWPRDDNANIPSTYAQHAICIVRGTCCDDPYDPGVGGQNHIFRLSTLYDNTFKVQMGTSRYNIDAIYEWTTVVEFQPQHSMTAEQMKTEILTGDFWPNTWLTTNDLIVTKHFDDGEYFLIELTGAVANTYFQMHQTSDPYYSGINFSTVQAGTSNWVCPTDDDGSIDVTEIGVHTEFTSQTSPIDGNQVWTPGIPVDTDNIACVIEGAPSALIVTVVVQFNIESVFPYIVDQAELYIWYESPPVGVLVGGKADIEQLGVIYEYPEGGITVGGQTSQGITGLASGGAKVGGVVRQFLFYTAIGGVIVERSDVELFLEFEEYSDTTAEDTSSHERHADLVNMDSTNFIDGRKANNKVIDFEV